MPSNSIGSTTDVNVFGTIKNRVHIDHPTPTTSIHTARSHITKRFSSSCRIAVSDTPARHSEVAVMKPQITIGELDVLSDPLPLYMYAAWALLHLLRYQCLTSRLTEII